MAQQTLGIVGSEPLFYGEDTLAHGLSAEDWLRRLDAYRAANPNVADDVIASLATGWLRGPAALYFAETLPFTDAAAHVAAMAAWPQFRAAFHDRYCRIISTADISIDWANLRQGEHESVSAFGDRVCQVMQRYSSLLTLPPLPANDLHDLTDAIGVIRAADAPVPARQRVTDLIMAALTRAGQRALRATITDMATKTLAGGLKNAKLRELVRREERNHTAFLPILVLVRAADRIMVDNRAAGAPGKGKANTAAVGASNDGSPALPRTDSESDTGVEAVHGSSSRGRGQGASRGGGRGRGRGRGAGRGAGSSSSSRKDGLPKTPCPMCNQMGHWKKDCPLLANLLPAQTTAVSHGPPSSKQGAPPQQPFPPAGPAPQGFYSPQGPPQQPFYPPPGPPQQTFYSADAVYARAPPDQGNFFATV